MIDCMRWLAVLSVLSAIGCSGNGQGGDAAVDGGTNDAGGLPGFGQACRPIAQQGDPQCASGLVCITVSPEQGRNLCTKTCATADAPCVGGPTGTTPTCGREFQVASGISRVCEFRCDPGAPNCPPGLACLADFEGMMVCQPSVQ